MATSSPLPMQITGSKICKQIKKISLANKFDKRHVVMPE
jgi:hypothetical protein